MCNAHGSAGQGAWARRHGSEGCVKGPPLPGPPTPSCLVPPARPRISFPPSVPAAPHRRGERGGSTCPVPDDTQA